MAELTDGVPILRLFRARALSGRQAELAAKLATTSAELVSARPGFLGYLAAGPAAEGARDFAFISLWSSFSAMKALFGESWRESLLPPGYAGLIESHSVEHFHLSSRAPETAAGIPRRSGDG